MLQVPSVKKDQVMELEVEVQGDTFYSKRARKVMIKSFNPQSFIQSDKPIYLPGQTGNLHTITVGHHRTANYHVCMLMSPSALQTRLTGLKLEAICCQGESSSDSANNPRVSLVIS